MNRKILNGAMLMLVMFITQAACAGKPENKVLVFAKTQGFFHSSIPKGMITLMNICKQQGIVVDTSRDASVFTIDKLMQYKVVVFLNTTGDILNDEQQAAFQNFIRSGGGFVGIHAATDTEYDWSWYNKLVGAYFLSHPPNQQVAVIKVADKTHPATEFLPDKWIRTDEWYDFKDLNPDVKVLAYLDENSYKGGQNGEVHPFIWCHEFYGGRAFYTGAGHREDNYDELLLQKHFLAAIKWAGKIK
ncbi:MAG TPA: ThuA domain-containing protein [Bacteroidales bacterium]|nr:ThuA domain-containing protein [Bacteroidales bacterium]